MSSNISDILSRLKSNGPPHIEITKGTPHGDRLGVFSSSFNPPTIAHVELIDRAAEAFSLDAVLALAGKTNADKTLYECSLEDRLEMLTLTFANDDRVSTGLSSHAFYVDMIDALQKRFPGQTDLHFIVGFDTFERVLDSDDKYTDRYFRRFSRRTEALEYLFTRSSFIVAGRSGSGFREVKMLIEGERAVPADRVMYLDFPADLGELSATEVRERRRAGRQISGLVPATVEKYILEHGLY